MRFAAVPVPLGPSDSRAATRKLPRAIGARKLEHSCCCHNQHICQLMVALLHGYCVDMPNDNNLNSKCDWRLLATRVRVVISHMRSCDLHFDCRLLASPVCESPFHICHARFGDSNMPFASGDFSCTCMLAIGDWGCARRRLGTCLIAVAILEPWEHLRGAVCQQGGTRKVSKRKWQRLWSNRAIKLAIRALASQWMSKSID